MPTLPNASILALDVGEKRIGIARASREARLASPLVTLANDAGFAGTLQRLIEQHGAQTVVVGLPRNLSGDDTPQTAYVRQFAAQLQRALSVSVVFQDEAATSLKAENELRQRGKGYTKEDIDSLSATYILEDYLGGTRD